MNNPYDFPNTIAIKMLIKRDDKILLVREPDFNDWMPNRLGLPGGKPLKNETLEDALSRKIKTEVGLEIAVKGIVRIIDILMPEKTVYHFIVAADYISGEIGDVKTESDDISWYSQEQISAMNKDDYTEYYNDEIIKSFLSGELAILPMTFIQNQDNRTGEVSEWMSKGSKLID